MPDDDDDDGQLNMKDVCDIVETTDNQMKFLCTNSIELETFNNDYDNVQYIHTYIIP